MFQGTKLENERRQKILQLIGPLPVSYDERHKALQEWSHLFHDEMAYALQATLDQKTSQLKPMDLEQRRTWTQQLREQLSALHLAFHNPRSGNAAGLYAESLTSDPKRPQYALRDTYSDKPGTAFKSHELPPLYLKEVIQSGRSLPPNRSR